ncbi:hypothetical protein [Altererythrobacter aquiaggeris]|uniref:hypothetical protein n=1 Tax=Aestuarierythrobacter aquiaggeris TaxID=1898396 RepID=UPI003015A6C3
MFIGHWAPALAAAAVSPRAPKLGTLFIAAQLVDWGFAVFALLGIEKMRIVPGITVMNPMDLYHMPFTHSLLGTLGWAAAFAALIFAFSRDKQAALVGGAVVISHWVLDLLVHRPDLTLAGGGPKLGFGLWNYPAIEIPLELAITFGALFWYHKRTRGPVGPVLVLGAVLFLFQMISWFGPQPTVIGPALFIAGMAAFALITLIAMWVGRTRKHLAARG